jgi:hypothetical protein
MEEIIMKFCNIKVLNEIFYRNDGSSIPAFSYEVSDFVAKTNNIDLVSETMYTIFDSKKNKKVPLAKKITKKEDYTNSEAEVNYSHMNKYVEKYKVINTTFNTTQETDDVKSIYVVTAIPYNGIFSSIDIANVSAGSVEIITARNVSTDAIKFGPEDKILYSKVCYLIFKIDPSENDEYSGFDINFTTISYKWSDDKSSCSQIARNITFTVPVEFIVEDFEVDSDNATMVKPEIKSTNMYAAQLNENGKPADQPVKFNNLFKINIDKTIKDHNNDYSTKSNFYTRSKSASNNYLASNKNSYNEQQPSRRSKKFEEAKKRYSEDDE